MNSGWPVLKVTVCIFCSLFQCLHISTFAQQMVWVWSRIAGFVQTMVGGDCLESVIIFAVSYDVAIDKNYTLYHYFFLLRKVQHNVKYSHFIVRLLFDSNCYCKCWIWPFLALWPFRWVILSRLKRTRHFHVTSYCCPPVEKTEHVLSQQPA